MALSSIWEKTTLATLLLLLCIEEGQPPLPNSLRPARSAEEKGRGVERERATLKAVGGERVKERK
jgi:hypothetical protein